MNRMIGDHVAEAADVTNTVTAGGLAALMAGITDGSLLGADATRTALDLLSRQTHRRMIPAGLPEGTWSASKGGWVPGVAHDVALVRPPVAPPYVLAICTTSALPDGEAEALVARLSAVTWEHWTTMARLVQVATARMARPLHTPFVTALRRTGHVFSVVVRVTDADGRDGVR